MAGSVLIGGGEQRGVAARSGEIGGPHPLKREALVDNSGRRPSGRCPTAPRRRRAARPPPRRSGCGSRRDCRPSPGPRRNRRWPGCGCGSRASGRSPVALIASHTCAKRSPAKRTTCRIGPNTSRLAGRGRRSRRRAGAKKCPLAPSAAAGRALRLPRGRIRALGLQRALRLGVDHRADIGLELHRIAELELRHRAREHLQHARRYPPAGTARATPSSAGRRCRRPRSPHP